MTQGKKISRTNLKYLVDTLMFLCILGIVFVGLLQAFVIPEGPTAEASAKYFLGLHRHQWGHVHLYLSLAFTALLVIHIILAWGWIKGKAARIFGKGWKAALVGTVLAAVLVPFVFWGLASKYDPAYAEYGVGAGRRGGRLAEIERHGLPLKEIPPIKASEETPVAAEVTAEVKAAPQEAEHEDKVVAGRLSEEPAEYLVTGQMTLQDIERETGVSAALIVSKLGLPANVSRSETLGRLRRRYGFSVIEVRDIVAAALKEKR